MTRADLARRIYEAHGGMTHAEARQMVDEVLHVMIEGLCREKHFLISGFGTFKVVSRKARTGRDLGKGNPVHIPAFKTVVFVPSRQWSSGNRT